MNTETVINTLELEKYVITMYSREIRNSYPNHPYLVELKRLTPKAKYSACKIEWRYVYRSEAEAIEKLYSTFNTLKSNIDRHTERKNETRKANSEVKAADFYKEGDIISNSWGYEQTNVNFYQVVKVGNKTIDIEEIGQIVEEGSIYSHGMACNVLPAKNRFVENGDHYRLRVKAQGYLSSVESFYYMKKWDGSPEYKSWYA